MKARPASAGKAAPPVSKEERFGKAARDRAAKLGLAVPPPASAGEALGGGGEGGNGAAHGQGLPADHAAEEAKRAKRAKLFQSVADVSAPGRRGLVAAADAPSNGGGASAAADGGGAAGAGAIERPLVRRAGAGQGGSGVAARALQGIGGIGRPSAAAKAGASDGPAVGPSGAGTNSAKKIPAPRVGVRALPSCRCDRYRWADAAR